MARWRALILACAGVLMVAFDATIVNVALSSIGTDLGVSGISLVSVVTGYIVPFAGFLPVCGRLGDNYGHGRVFLGGIVLFALASLACSLAPAAGLLVGARIVQGVAGAAVTAVSMPLILKRFVDPAERVKVLVVLTSVSASGSSVGLLLGGLLTTGLSWRWIFLINLPIAAVVCVLSPVFRLHVDDARRRECLDIGGALTITTALMLAIFGVVGAAGEGWWSATTVLSLSGGVASGVAFVAIESWTHTPLLPLRLLGNRYLVVGMTIAALWAAAQTAWFFLCSLYLQLVLKFSSFEVGLAFLPAALSTVAFSFGASSRLTTRFGVALPVATGMSLVAAGLALFSHAPVNAAFMVDVLPGMVLLGVGSGIASSPLMVGALREVGEVDYGAASGIFSSATVLGGAVALALLASIASARTSILIKASSSLPEALNDGYHLAFRIGVLVACGAALMSAWLFRKEGSTVPIR